ncbi:MAG: ABC transporter substrate-binding protein, partial [Polaromonas sp.]|nr:ABC transporter substrate-binding protein [Polaromonas sp.]
ASGKSVVVAQIVDVSQAQQDVSKDFLIGSRAAWQDINLRGGVNGRKVLHQTLETDGTLASVKQALGAALDNPDCVVLSGCVGDGVASQLLEMSRSGGSKMAHAAPWLQNSTAEIDEHTFPIFAARQAQITHALQSLSVMGLKELGAVYGSAQNFQADHLEVERIAASLKLKLHSFQAGASLRALGQKLTAATPGILLFLGGTPELAEFTQGLEQQARQRYVVALADVNLQVLAQMGVAKGTPIIATQPVPMATNAMPLVRSYRETMTRLFDEPPTPLSLAGFLAARYTFEVMNSADGTLSRKSALATFQKRSDLDLGGFRVSFNAQRRSDSYVTQSMLARDGRAIG